MQRKVSSDLFKLSKMEDLCEHFISEQDERKLLTIFYRSANNMDESAGMLSTQNPNSLGEALFEKYVENGHFKTYWHQLIRSLFRYRSTKIHLLATLALKVWNELPIEMRRAVSLHFVQTFRPNKNICYISSPYKVQPI